MDGALWVSRARLVAFFCLAYLLHGNEAQSQGYPKQFSITTENDTYVLQKTDRYYTNGIFLNYSHIGRTNKSFLLKKVVQYELAQKLYTPYKRQIYQPRSIDRPITGYLYGKYSQTYFLKQGNLLQWGASVASIGKAAFGEPVHTVFHKLFKINSDWYGWIWNYELKQEVGGNVHFKYAKSLINTRKDKHHFQLTPVTQATAGTLLTNVSQGLLLQAGNFNAMHQNAWFNGSLESGDKAINKKEFFLFYYPEVQYHFYNATVQGGRYLKDKGPIVGEIEPMVIIHQLGASYSFRRYSFSAVFTFQSKEAKSQRNNHQYGSFTGAYRFK